MPGNLWFLIVAAFAAAYFAFIVLFQRTDDLTKRLATAEEQIAVMSRAASEAYRLAMLDKGAPPN